MCGRRTFPEHRAVTRAAPFLGAWLCLIALTGPILADPLKSMMGEMAQTTKEAKAALASNNRAAFDAILRDYADEGKAGMALFPGGSAKSQDLRTRFSTFATTADTARQGGNPAKFKAAFSSLVGECRSCHGVYK